ncbi:MAG: MBOAT family O-acyltransferase [Bacteroidia bacterium]|nr:MBOAT family O-acyltransferase [Bacteroidia bacterium]
MLFNSFIFLVFLLVVLPLFYYSPPRFRNPILLVASYVFYGYWDWRFCFLLLGSTTLDFFLGQAMHRLQDEKQRKQLLVFSVVVNLTILGIFKYFNFFAESFNAMTSAMGMTLDQIHLNVILPVGISFYTFQSMSYVIDVYRRRMEPARNFLDFTLYVAFFSQLVAGPIERAIDLLPQIERGLQPTRKQIIEGIQLIVIGMFLKVLVGDASGRIVDHIFAEPERYASLELLMGLVLFSIQIYADFSGYSIIARGTAKLVGAELMINFEQPYLSANITEFWRRWHISLSNWLKDYLYISLGGNRKGEFRTYVNLFITMLLGGLWHGASWNFVIWGALHGVYLAIHKMALGKKKIDSYYTYTGPLSFVQYLFSVVGTYILVLFAWLFFRAKTLGEVGIFLDKMVHWVPGEMGMRLAGITAGFAFIVILMDTIMYRTRRQDFTLLVQPVSARWGLLAALMVISMIYMFISEPLPFVYFQF